VAYFFCLKNSILRKRVYQKFVDEAMKQGDISKEEGEKFLDNMKQQVEEKATGAEKSMHDEIHKQLKALGLATKEDITSLRREITALKHEIQNKQA
jgi:polyhydroxyalkanoate synthesis regulator phasin